MALSEERNISRSQQVLSGLSRDVGLDWMALDTRLLLGQKAGWGEMKHWSTVIKMVSVVLYAPFAWATTSNVQGSLLVLFHFPLCCC